mgnify:CR=1 FL=1
MSKSFGKFLLCSALVAGAAYGAYSYLQKKDIITHPAAGDDTDDDFDDFSEDLDEDLTSPKERSYVSLNLDKAEALATEAFHKAKEVITDSVQQVKDTVKSVADNQSTHTSFTDLSEIAKEDVKAASEAAKDAEEEVKEAVADTITKAADKAEQSEDTVEEFFDDEDPEP